jgi:ATP-binding cassette subfamily F protein 3
MKEYIGDIYDFLEQRRIQSLKELESAQRSSVNASDGDPVSQNKINWEKRKENEKEIRKVKTQIGKCESEIDRLESEIKVKEGMLASPEKYQKKIQDGSLYREYEDLKLSLEREMKRWEELSYELEIMES